MLLLQPSITTRTLFLFTCIIFYAASLQAQDKQAAFIKLVNPTKDRVKASARRQFIIGSTCKTCNLTVNGEVVKVHSSGGFAYEVNLGPVTTDSLFTIEASANGRKPVVRKLLYSTDVAKLPAVSATASIDHIQTSPAEDLVLKVGDKIQIKVKATSGGSVTTYNGTLLYEMSSQNAVATGLYQGEYIVSAADTFSDAYFPVKLVTTDGQVLIKNTASKFSVLSALASDVAVTTGPLAHLEYGLGTDRLGGAKIGYLDSLVQLKIIGKVGADYKIRLAENRIAYIPDDLVKLAPRGTFSPQSLTGSWSVYGDSAFDYVSIGLAARLPYQSFHELNPSRILVDVFGATNNTNWISQLKSMAEIDHVDYEQVADDIFRIKIQLKHRQHWGHRIYYQGNNLVIKIKHQPADLSIAKMLIAVDAGHGGSNTGAGGPTGSMEKNLALAVALKLKERLEEEGTRVLMTRTTEKLVENKERMLMYRERTPDLLVSIHLNSASDPLRAGGTSTHYRYISNRKLSVFVNARMQELGLKQYGVIGSFNFMLNSPTEYPNVLVETLFISNPAEEALILEESFQEQMAEKILLGISDFLEDAARN